MNCLNFFSSRFGGLFLFVFLLFSANSCTYYVETLESSVGNNYLSDFHYSKVVSQVQDAANVLFKGHKLTNGPQIKFDSARGFNTITLFYGDTFSVNYDGIRRKGKVTASWNGDYYLPGTEVIITMYNGFVSNGWLYEGTIKLTSLDLNEYAQPEFLMETTGWQIIDRSTAENYNWTNVYTRTQVKGANTLTSEDDIWSISGIVYARNEKGRYYNAVIKDSLYFDNSCEYGITKGRVDIAPVDDDQRLFVDYGTETKCQPWVTFKRGSRVVTVTKNR